MVKLSHVHAARGRIRSGIVHTPCKPSHAFQDEVPGQLYWKFENLQRTGSFKDRGALNKLLLLSPEETERGVVTASAGNHAQALAYLVVKVRDRPGSLASLTDSVARMGANVLDIHHRRGFADIRVGDVEIVLQLETRGRDHVAEIIQALEAQGVSVEVEG